MTLPRLMTAVAVAALLTGCASWDTPYQAAGLRGGYSDTRLSEGQYRVNFMGNGFSFDGDAADFALLRAAELCRTNGYSHIEVLSQTIETVPLSYYNASLYSMQQTGTAPHAHVVVQCLKAPAANARPVADVITAVRSAHADNIPK